MCRRSRGSANVAMQQGFSLFALMERGLPGTYWLLSSEEVPMPRVLIVDDEENQRKTLSIGLRLEGFEVVAAANGEEALRLLAAHAVDSAVVDLMIPGTNGLELTR